MFDANNDRDRLISDWQKRHYDPSEFISLVGAIESENQFKQIYGLIGIRKLLCNWILQIFFVLISAL